MHGLFNRKTDISFDIILLVSWQYNLHCYNCVCNLFQSDLINKYLNYAVPQVTGKTGPRERELRLCEPRQPWYYVPLKNIIDTHKALLKGHVLLGFLKDGIHLISYLCQVEILETLSFEFRIYVIDKGCKE